MSSTTSAGAITSWTICVQKKPKAETFEVYTDKSGFFVYRRRNLHGNSPRKTHAGRCRPLERIQTWPQANCAWTVSSPSICRRLRCAYRVSPLLDQW